LRERERKREKERERERFYLETMSIREGGRQVEEEEEGSVGSRGWGLSHRAGENKQGADRKKLM